eukprot:gb/GECG01014219.1/.p1 GENE.gb/GECG01014219.1/~~gb/GECG01014219.1/.p1  ORF type:complete len:354 (+),score=41.92 gb/GECG01014219.1/:1-1062(+)
MMKMIPSKLAPSAARKPLLTSWNRGCFHATARVMASSVPSPGEFYSPMDLIQPDKDADSFERICYARHACKKFDASKPVDQTTLQRILDLTQRSPSGFNLQPYQIIVVQDTAVKELLADAALGGNGDKIREAPVVTVFAADLEATRRIESVVETEKAAGTRSPRYLNSLPFDASIFAPGAASALWRRYNSSNCGEQQRRGKESDTGNEVPNPDKNREYYEKMGNRVGSLANAGREVLSETLSNAVTAAKSLTLATVSAISGRSVPTVNSPEGWSFKHSMIAASTYLYAATAHGLATAPMEGIDSRKMKIALEIPNRFEIPVVIPTGHSLQESHQLTPRLKRSEVVSFDKYSHQ